MTQKIKTFQELLSDVKYFMFFAKQPLFLNIMYVTLSFHTSFPSFYKTLSLLILNRCLTYKKVNIHGSLHFVWQCRLQCGLFQCISFRIH